MINCDISISFCFGTTYRCKQNEDDEDDISIITATSTSSSICDFDDEDELDFFGIDIDLLIEDFDKLTIFDSFQDKRPCDDSNVSHPVAPASNDNKILNVQAAPPDLAIDTLIEKFKTLSVVESDEEPQPCDDNKIVQPIITLPYKSKLKLTVVTTFDADDKQQASALDQGNGTPLTPKDLPKTPETASPRFFTFQNVDTRLPFRRFVLRRKVETKGSDFTTRRRNTCAIKTKRQRNDSTEENDSDDDGSRSRRQRKISSHENGCIYNDAMSIDSPRRVYDSTATIQPAHSRVDMNAPLWSRDNCRKHLSITFYAGGCCPVF